MKLLSLSISTTYKCMIELLQMIIIIIIIIIIDDHRDFYRHLQYACAGQRTIRCHGTLSSEFPVRKYRHPFLQTSDRLKANRRKLYWQHTAARKLKAASKLTIVYQQNIHSILITDRQTTKRDS